MFNTNHYKSWSGLNKQLQNNLCDELKGRITYFLTYYRKVHNSYGRASISLNKHELINFSWVEMLKQDSDYHNIIGTNDSNDIIYEVILEKEMEKELLKSWNEEAVLSDHDFLLAATDYLQLPIDDALKSNNYIIKIFAILDKRVGKRTLEKIKLEGDYKNYPEWVQKFYELRLESGKI